MGRAFSREYKAENKTQTSCNCSLAIPEGENHRKLDLYSKCPAHPHSFSPRAVTQGMDGRFNDIATHFTRHT